MTGYCHACGRHDSALDPYTFRCAACTAAWVTSRITATAPGTGFERSP